MRQVTANRAAIYFLVLISHPFLADVTAAAAQPDPGRILGAPTSWHWYRNRTATQLKSATDKYGDRIIDVDVVGKGRYTAAMVRNNGPFKRKASGHWFYGKTRDQVVALTKDASRRLIDLEPYVQGGKLRFAGSRVPKEGLKNCRIAVVVCSKDFGSRGIGD